MRRGPETRPEHVLALAVAEIERIKATLTRLTDGRILVIDTGTGGSDTTPPPESAAHVLYGSKHTRALRVTDGGGLNINFEQGQIWIGGTFFSIVAGVLLMTDAATNNVFVNTAGAVASNTTTFPEGSVPLATVVTAAGGITSVNDRRSYLLPGAASAGFPHDADQIIDDDADTSVEVERGVDDDTIRLRAATVDVAFITSAGQWTLPITGAGAGILMGGDAQLYRNAANRLAVAAGDQLEIISGLGGIAISMVQGNYLLMHSPTDQNWRIGKSTAHDMEWYGAGAGARAWRFRDSGAGNVNRFVVEMLSGQVRIPTIGSGAGLLIGGDGLIYRSAADVLTIPDQLTLQQQTLGNEVLRLESIATNDDPRESVFQQRVATTDATVTTLHAITIPASTTVFVEARVVARRTGGYTGAAEDGATYILRASVKNMAGTATLIGAAEQTFVREDQGGWDAIIDVTAATARVRITGAVDNNITWHSTLRTWQIGS